MVHSRIVHDSGVVNVVNVGDIYVVDGAIVEKVSAVPTSAFIPITEVSESVRNSPIESDVRAPPACMEKIYTAAPTPPRRSPEEADFGSQHPCARHPIIISIIGIPCPVARSPDVTLSGARRLLVNGERGWTEIDRYSYAHLGVRRRRQRDQYQREK
jgi:hypothetical protein